MPKRHHDALAAQAGACNSLALCNSLIAAIAAARHENGGDFALADADPAVRLIAHQLAFLLNVRALDTVAIPDPYLQALLACEGASMADHERARA